jgi:glycosyltransferase involved in cell wall biosynthesis
MNPPSGDFAIAAFRTRDERLSVLVTTTAAGRPGGVGQYMRNLRPYLPSEVQYFPVGSLADGEPIGSAVWRTLSDARQFARVLRQGKFELVHLNAPITPKALLREGLLLVIAKSLHKTVLVFTHGWDDAFERRLLKYWSWAFRLIFGRADACVVLGEEFKRRLRRLGYLKTVFMGDAPVEDGLLALQPRLSERAGWDRKGFNILFLARVEKEKGIYETIETYRIVKGAYPFVSLTVAGDGSHLKQAVEYARMRNLDGVSFIGHVDGARKYQIFQEADVFLFPSYGEGLPLSVLEAMASGLPVVTSAVGGLCDFFEDGRMGFMTKNRDPHVLAELVTRLLDNVDLRNRIITFNQNFARTRFTSAQVAAQMEWMYRSLLSTPQ